MPKHPLTRRELIEKCAALGVVVTATSLPISAIANIWDDSEVRHATPPNDFGPFYKKHSPQARELRAAGDPGLPLTVTGRIVDTRGDALEDAKVEIWHADHFGHYDLDGYRFRALLPLDSKAAYRFDSIMPGHYPSRVCQHIHFLIHAPGHKPLVTQLYFATDPVFEGDPQKNFARDPLLQTAELVRPVVLTGDPKTMHAAVNFDLCLERL